MRRKRILKGWFVLPESSFGRCKLTSLSLSSDYFGRIDKRWTPDVRSTFQGRWKVLRKRILKDSFGLPKSSFGEHEAGQTHRHAIIMLSSFYHHLVSLTDDTKLWVGQTHQHAIIILWLDSCVQLACYHHAYAFAFDMQGSIERSLTRLECMLFNTARMHAL